MAELTISSDEIRSAIANYTSSYSAEASREEVGVVISAADGIAQVSGLPSVMANELLEFPGGVIGVAQNLDTNSIGVVVPATSSPSRRATRLRGPARFSPSQWARNSSAA